MNHRGKCNVLCETSTTAFIPCLLHTIRCVLALILKMIEFVQAAENGSYVTKRNGNVQLVISDTNVFITPGISNARLY